MNSFYKKIYKNCEVQVKWYLFSITTQYDPNVPISTSLSKSIQKMTFKNTFKSSPESIKHLKHQRVSVNEKDLVYNLKISGFLPNEF